MSETLFLQIPGRFFIAMVRAYQIFISPLILPCCRFYPSCSEYAIDAITLYGPYRGTLLAVMRLLRCHPFHPGGYDPVK
jgi:putative membrane protein insertion efficiency factor